MNVKYITENITLGCMGTIWEMTLWSITTCMAAPLSKTVPGVAPNLVSMEIIIPIPERVTIAATPGLKGYLYQVFCHSG